jgi:hypothetical protein
MLEGMRRIWRETVEAFRSEVDAREPEDVVAGMLGSMRREMVEQRVLISRLRDDLPAAAREVEAERERLAACVRRRELAARIDDQETVRVAAEYEERHRERERILEMKRTALAEELRVREAELEEMRRRYAKADAERAALVAELRGSSRAAAAAELDEEESAARRMDARFAEQEAERRLEELKRRMGREG